MAINETIFDNEYSLLYKVAEYYNVPAKYVLFTRSPIENVFGPNTYSSETLDLQLIDLENWLKNNDLELAELLRIFPSQSAPQLTIKDFIFFWADGIEGNPFGEIESVGRLCFGLDCKDSYLEYATETEFNSDYNTWKKQYNQDNTARHRIFQQITELQKRLAQLEPHKLSEPTTELVTIKTSLKLNNNPITINDGIDLFALIQASAEVPFILYRNAVGKAYYKLYEPLFKEPPNSLVTAVNHIETVDKNNIMYFVTLVDKSSERARGLHYDYQVYRIDRNELLITTNLLDMDRTTLLNRIIQAFSNSAISFSDLMDRNIGGTFTIPKVLIDDYVFLHLVMNDDLFINYLNLNERSKTAADQTNHLVYYRSLNIVSADEKKEGEGVIKGEIENRMHFRFIQQEDSTLVRFTKVPSDKVLGRFQNILARLLSSYISQHDTIHEIYDYLIPDLYTVSAEEGFTARRKVRGAAGAPLIHGGDVKLVDLKEDSDMADLIIAGFSRQCQQKQLAMRLPENLLPQNPPTDELFEHTFVFPIDGKKTRFNERQILPFPKGEAKFYFFCPSDEYPYPGVQHNHLRNSETYPYTPCCFKDDQSAKNLGYAEFYLNKEMFRKNIVPTISRKNISHKIAKLPKTIETYLTAYSNKANQFVRYGLQTSPNSFIHAILTAKNIKEYNDLETDEEREEYVRDVRKNLLNIVDDAVFKQELYDRTPVQIHNDIEDLDKYFDPRLYIRGLEEAYNVNIYLLTGDINDMNSGNFVIPRHKIMYIKPYRPDRQSIILFITQVKNEDPQCNLIIAQPQTIKAKTGTRLVLTVRQFGESMTKLLHDGLSQTYMQYITASPLLTIGTANNVVSSAANVLETYRNIYYFLDYLSLDIEPKAQILDSYGKSRGLIINTDAGDVTVFTLPSQPGNLPDFFATNRTVPLANADLAINIFGQPIAYSTTQEANKQTEEKVIGLWYAFGDILQALYVPIVPTSKNKFGALPNVPTITYPPIKPVTNDSIENYLNNKWTASILIQIINWLYNLSNDTITTFIKEYTKIERTPSLNLRAINRKLPNDITLSEALDYLEETVPSFVKDGKILLDNEKLRTNVSGRLKIMQGYPSPIEGNFWVLFDYYSDVMDFPRYPHNDIFIEKKNFQAWLMSINRGNGAVPILSSLSNDIIITILPVIYQNDKDGKIYLVQTFAGHNDEDEKRQALACAQNWINLKVNTGALTEPLTDKILPPHVIYQLQTLGGILPSQDLSKGKIPYYQILLLKPSPEIKRYAALLPLL